MSDLMAWDQCVGCKFVGKLETMFECANCVAAREAEFPSDIGKRLDVMSTMRDGWHDEHPDSKAPTTKAIEVARAVLPALGSIHSFDDPYPYPTLDGGVRIEWDIREWSVELTFSADGQTVVMNASARGRMLPGRLVSVETTTVQMDVIVAVLRHLVSSA